MMLAMTNGTSRHWRLVLAGMVGAALSDILVIAAVGLGLGALLAASEAVFSVLRWAGVLYLVWLSVQLWKNGSLKMSEESFLGLTVKKAFFRSFAVALSNPKMLLFFSAFLPQFIETSQPLALQYGALALLSAGIDILVMGIYAMGGAQVARMLTSKGLGLLNRLCASVMLCLAAILALYRKAHV